jgi:hypothetical protein
MAPVATRIWLATTKTGIFMTSSHYHDHVSLPQC